MCIIKLPVQKQEKCPLNSDILRHYVTDMDNMGIHTLFVYYMYFRMSNAILVNQYATFSSVYVRHLLQQDIFRPVLSQAAILESEGK